MSWYRLAARLGACVTLVAATWLISDVPAWSGRQQTELALPTAQWVWQADTGLPRPPTPRGPGGRRVATVEGVVGPLTRPLAPSWCGHASGATLLAESSDHDNSGAPATPSHTPLLLRWRQPVSPHGDVSLTIFEAGQLHGFVKRVELLWEATGDVVLVWEGVDAAACGGEVNITKWLPTGVDQPIDAARITVNAPAACPCPAVAAVRLQAPLAFDVPITQTVALGLWLAVPACVLVVTALLTIEAHSAPSPAPEDDQGPTLGPEDQGYIIGGCLFVAALASGIACVRLCNDTPLIRCTVGRHLFLATQALAAATLSVWPVSLSRARFRAGKSRRASVAAAAAAVAAWPRAGSFRWSGTLATGLLLAEAALVGGCAWVVGLRQHDVTTQAPGALALALGNAALWAACAVGGHAWRYLLGYATTGAGAAPPVEAAPTRAGAAAPAAPVPSAQPADTREKLE